MAWMILFLAGLAETAWAIGLKYTDGFTRPIPSVITVSLMAVSFLLLAKAMQTLPLGTSYAIWVGIGACGTLIAGIILFDESRDLLRLLCVGLIVAGIVGLKLVERAPEKVVPVPVATIVDDQEPQQS
jgi:quaternary ammonium compound-resistance protein SugE